VAYREATEVVKNEEVLSLSNRENLDVFAHQTLFDQRPENQAPNAAEPVNCYFNCHSSISVLIRVPKLTAHLTDR
jgi:methionine-rich copper-binding protein CopC